VGKGHRLKHATISVFESRDGIVQLIYKSKSLSYVKFSKNNRPQHALTRKDINVHLDKKKAKHILAMNHPWRNYKSNNYIEKMGDSG